MEYNKTLRWCEPYGGWAEHDTGLCNRILHWEIAHEIAEKHNFEYKIILQKLHWPELDLIYLPNSSQFRFFEYEFGIFHQKKFQDLRFKTIFDIENESVRLASPLKLEKVTEMFRTKNFDLSEDNHWYADFGFNEMKKLYKRTIRNRPLQHIKLKHNFIEDFLRRNTKDVIGIHIRRNSGVRYSEEDVLSLPESVREKYKKFQTNNDAIHFGYRFLRDDKYFKIIDEILKLKPEQKFYISSDLPCDMLHYYKDRYPGKILMKEDFLPVINDYLINCSIDLKNLERGNVVENIVDLFALSFCCFLIKSNRSTWSEFAMYYRRQPSVYVTESWENKIKPKFMKPEWGQPGSYDFDEELDNKEKSKTFIKDVQGMAVGTTTRNLI